MVKPIFDLDLSQSERVIFSELLTLANIQISNYLTEAEAPEKFTIVFTDDDVTIPSKAKNLARNQVHLVLGKISELTITVGLKRNRDAFEQITKVPVFDSYQFIDGQHEVTLYTELFLPPVTYLI